MHADVVNILIQAAPTTVNVESQTGMIALRQSIWNDDVGVMNLLLQAGATTVDGGSDTALHYAALSGNLNVTTELMQRSVDRSPRNRRGVTPMHLAALCGDTALISLFRTAGADSSCRDHKGCMPIHMAAYYAQVTTLNILVEKAADLQVQDEIGRTPLHYLGGVEGISGTAAVKQVQLYSGKTEKFSGSASSASIAIVAQTCPSGTRLDVPQCSTQR